MTNGGNVTNPPTFDGTVRDRRRAARSYPIISGVSFGVGALALAAGSALYLRGDKDRQRGAQADDGADAAFVGFGPRGGSFALLGASSDARALSLIGCVALARLRAAGRLLSPVAAQRRLSLLRVGQRLSVDAALRLRSVREQDGDAACGFSVDATAAGRRPLAEHQSFPVTISALQKARRRRQPASTAR